MDVQTALRTYDTVSSQLYHLECISALLGWDQQVYMPEGGAGDRARQDELIHRYHHQLATSEELWQAVDYLYENIDRLDEPDKVNIRETHRSLSRQRKLPESFIAQCARTFSEGYSRWVKARPQNDFDSVKDVLTRIIDLCRQEADLVGYQEHPYDALIDKFEPYSTIGSIKPLLTELGSKLSSILGTITDRFVSVEPLSGYYPTAEQESLIHRTVSDLGFSFDTGRMDTTAHPFMTTIGTGDFRITTRYNENNFLDALYSSVHETGHALYELGLDKAQAGKPMGSAVSMGIHESQSRFWENIIGRSREFCMYLEKAMYGLWDAPANLWELANSVKPSLIRIDADEVTYSLHIVVRMLLEEELMSGKLTVDQLPGAWNDLYEKYLGVRSDSYKNGVMQDVHWFSGSIGYFPSYALGNLYNSAMYEKMLEDDPGALEGVQAGDFSKPLNWLRINVHSQGMRYNAQQLIVKITGKELSISPFVDYIRAKYNC